MTKKTLSAALAVAVLAAAPTVASAAMSIVPAAYTEGVVSAIDVNAHTITVGGKSYALSALVTIPGSVTTGSEVDIAYVTENGKATVISLTPVRELTQRRILPFAIE